MPIQVLLADDHPIVREGFKTLLEREGLQVVGEASDGHEAVRLARTLHPDVAVLDLSMPLLNGLQAAQEILRASPRTRTILLTMYTEDHYVLEAVRIGIRGYVVKRQAVTDLVQAIREVGLRELAARNAVRFKRIAHRVRLVRMAFAHARVAAEP